MNNKLELLITNYLLNESNIACSDYYCLCPSVALSSIPGEVSLSMLGRVGLVLCGGGGGGLLAIDYILYNNINTAAADKH